MASVWLVVVVVMMVMVVMMTTAALLLLGNGTASPAGGLPALLADEEDEGWVPCSARHAGLGAPPRHRSPGLGSRFPPGTQGFP